MQETDRPLPLLFIRNRQAGTDDNLAEAIARVRFTDGSLRFHFQVGAFEFRVARDCVERRRKATRGRIDQQVFGCPSAFETRNCDGAGNWIPLGAESALSVPMFGAVPQATTPSLLQF